MSQLQSNYHHASFPQPSVCHATLAGTAVAITQRVGIVNVMYYTASQILQYCTHDTSTLRILPFLPDPGWTFDFFTSSPSFDVGAQGSSRGSPLGKSGWHQLQYLWRKRGATLSAPPVAPHGRGGALWGVSSPSDAEIIM